MNVFITYCDLFGVWDLLYEKIEGKLPLTQLQWKSANRPFRSIDVLDLEFSPFKQDVVEKSNLSALQLLREPYVHIFVLKCDDLETYRSQVRKMIREWHDIVTAKSQEWLIIHMATRSEDTSGSKAVNSKFLTLKASVFDKVKADFNQNSKGDRCVQVRLTDNDKDMEDSCRELTSKLKECVLTSFENRVSIHEEEVRKLDGQRSSPGWDYGTFFTIKEGLAQLFRHMCLFEDALIQYDELELVFMHTMKDNATSFASMEGIAKGDDQGRIMDTEYKSYQNLISQNSISVFDFRTYLFSRQANLLSMLQRDAEVCGRASQFITSMARSLKNAQKYQNPLFLQCWIISSCETILLHVRDKPTSPILSSSRCDLMLLQKLAFSKAGSLVGLYDEVKLADTCMNIETGNFEAKGPILPGDELSSTLTDITNSFVRNSLASKEQLYLAIEAVNRDLLTECKLAGRHNLLYQTNLDIAVNIL